MAKTSIVFLLTFLLLFNFGRSYVTVSPTTAAFEEITTKGQKENGHKCSDDICLPHQKCVEVQVQCFAAPCYPILECREKEHSSMAE
ncbi:hypothetical protein J437_LFUL008542 [Ladona fulva]|uniref:Uncharacterized protein n=1 Tax=Ladona fulva TaxID=123851 RepID=A0A8K0P3T8_LADFU|nr:hypothetical protein J437_LFUL008542 [Ladona fulva]